jgi:hypothetical protein
MSANIPPRVEPGAVFTTFGRAPELDAEICAEAQE